MQQQPSVIASGDYLYFAPAGQAFNIPAAGVVSNSAKPDPADPIWLTFGLGTVAKLPQDKRTSKAVTIMQPTIQGTIVPFNILRPQHELTMEVTMNEMSRLALTGFYKSPLIGLADTTFYPLTSSSLQGWLKRVRWQNGAPWITDDWWADLDCEEFTVVEPNIIQPKFKFTWLGSAPSTLNVSGI
jgi:hypothetical protein